MITRRPADERGRTAIGWLDSRHTFSFGEYYDPAHMGFRQLRVINEDWVQPGEGFGTHPHRDMEIFTWIVEGSLQHRDSMGTGSVIRPGEAQIMSAGTGITHSEYNHSSVEPVHLLQIWIQPERRGITPRYDQRAFPDEHTRDRLGVVVSPDERDGSIKIYQDAVVMIGRLGAGVHAEHPIGAGRAAWLQVVKGAVTANGTALAPGDGAALTGERAVAVEARTPAEVLLFDLA